MCRVYCSLCRLVVDLTQCTHTSTLVHTLAHSLAHTLAHEVRQQSVVSLTIKWRWRHFYNCSPQSNGTSIKARLQCVCASVSVFVPVCVCVCYGCAYVLRLQEARRSVNVPVARIMAIISGTSRSAYAMHDERRQCPLLFPSPNPLSRQHTHNI